MAFPVIFGLENMQVKSRTAPFEAPIMRARPGVLRRWIAAVSGMEVRAATTVTAVKAGAARRISHGKRNAAGGDRMLQMSMRQDPLAKLMATARPSQSFIAD